MSTPMYFNSPYPYPPSYTYRQHPHADTLSPAPSMHHGAPLVPPQQLVAVRFYDGRVVQGMIHCADDSYYHIVTTIPNPHPVIRPPRCPVPAPPTPVTR